MYGAVPAHARNALRSKYGYVGGTEASTPKRQQVLIGITRSLPDQARRSSECTVQRIVLLKKPLNEGISL